MLDYTCYPWDPVILTKDDVDTLKLLGIHRCRLCCFKDPDGGGCRQSVEYSNKNNYWRNTIGPFCKRDVMNKPVHGYAVYWIQVRGHDE